MPRAIDLSREPPPEATCYSCGGLVRLDRRARARGRFRCPLCTADNRVGPDGIGTPLSGAAERVDDMAAARCTACGAVNRIPLAILRQGRYTCHACRAVQQVPRTLRRRAASADGWLAAVLLLVIVGAGAWIWSRAEALRREVLLPVTGAVPDEAATEQDDVVIDGARLLGSRSDGDHFLVTGKVRNPYHVPATLHLKAMLTHQGKPISDRTVSFRGVAPGAWEQFEIDVCDDNRGWPDAVSVAIAGVS
ncbi:MAG: hypothetical protein HYU66_00840 [Armatimonadetes bacterium]|nr:hypothetical protein [Armatimonadota bacterium]